jgi:hypothetical protein
LISHPAKKEGIGPVEVLDRMTVQVFVRESFTVIAAPVQSDVDGIAKGSHHVRVPIANGRLLRTAAHQKQFCPLLERQSAQTARPDQPANLLSSVQEKSDSHNLRFLLSERASRHGKRTHTQGDEDSAPRGH